MTDIKFRKFGLTIIFIKFIKKLNYDKIFKSLEIFEMLIDFNIRILDS